MLCKNRNKARHSTKQDNLFPRGQDKDENSNNHDYKLLKGGYGVYNIKHFITCSLKFFHLKEVFKIYISKGQKPRF